MQKYPFLFLVLVSVLCQSCKFKVKDGIHWDTHLVTPILRSRIGLEDVIRDSRMLQSNPDHSLTVIFRDTLATLALSDYLVVPDTSYSARISLNSITLATDTLTLDITMGQILRQLCGEGNFAACLLYGQQGSSLSFFPPITGISSPDVPVDASQFFQEADLLRGMMVVRIENRLPLTVSSVTFHLRNDGSSQDTLVRNTMGPIPPGATVADSGSLAGKSVVSRMAAKLENVDMDSPQSFPFILDTNDYMRLQIIVKDLNASRAIAVFPAQRVLDDRSRINYRFDNGVEITRLKTKTGWLRLDAVSTLQDTIAFTYSLPTAVKDGQPVSLQGRLVPNLATGTAIATIDYELVDYYMDLTLNGDSINLFPFHITGDLLYSGRQSTMDLADSISVTYGLEGIVPAYIEGYLGTSTFHFADTLRLDFFQSILGGTIDLRNPTVRLSIDNSIGVDGELSIRQMEAINHRTGQAVGLTGAVMQAPTEVRGPRLPNVGQTISTPILLDEHNSNIRQFIGSLPDEIRFDMDVLINQNGNPALRDNFATDKSAVTAYLDIEIPLDGIADYLWLQDTLPIDLSEAALPKGVDAGTLKLVGTNQFPMEARVQVLFEDQTGAVFDSLFERGAQRLPAGQVGASGHVDVPGHGELLASFDQPRLTRLRQRGQRAITRFWLSTKPDGQPVKIYSTYGIDIQLVGDVTYRVGP
ncbi:MAG: hypothetical protein RLZZ165_2227 [Bacteroidota bacterium]|jgi:hypothetical protein